MTTRLGTACRPITLKDPLTFYPASITPDHQLTTQHRRLIQDATSEPALIKMKQTSDLFIWFRRQQLMELKWPFKRDYGIIKAAHPQTLLAGWIYFELPSSIKGWEWTDHRPEAVSYRHPSCIDHTACCTLFCRATADGTQQQSFPGGRKTSCCCRLKVTKTLECNELFESF